MVYYSTTVNKMERNYCVTRRELLVIMRILEPLRARVPHAHRELHPNLANKLQESAATDGPLGPAPSAIQLYFWAPIRSKIQHSRCPFLKTMPRKVYSLSKSLGARRSQTGATHCGLSCRRRDPAALRLKQLNDHDAEPISEEAVAGQYPEGRHCRQQNHVQELQDPTGIASSKGWHTGAPIVVH